MKRRGFNGAVAAAMMASLAPAVRAKPARGYIELSSPVPVDAPQGQIEVIEFFSYGCVHCMHFEPIFAAWEKAVPDDVDVRLVHVGFNDRFEPLQRIYFSLLALGEVDRVHAEVFDALQVQRKRLDQPEVLFDWVADHGIDRDKFEAAYKSFGVATQVRRSIELQNEYQVEGTPALGIAGRYYTDGSMAGGLEQMIRIANALIDEERQRS